VEPADLLRVSPPPYFRLPLLSRPSQIRSCATASTAFSSADVTRQRAGGMSARRRGQANLH